MKKFLIFVLAALFVVGMATIAIASAEGTSGSWDQNEDVNLTPKPLTGSSVCEHANTETVDLYPDGLCNAGVKVLRCKDCKEVLGNVGNAPAAGHKLDFNQVRNVVPGTCSKDGSEEVYCLQCGQWIKYTLSGGHDYTVIVEKKATCMAGGINKKVCKICGYWTTENTNPTGDHKFDLTAATTFVSERATCAAHGTYCAICTVCGGTFEWGRQVVASAYGADTTISKDAPHGTQVLKIAGGSHKWDAGRITKAPTCLEDGKIIYTCQYTTQTATHEPCYQTKEVTLESDEEVYDPRVQQKISKYHKLVEHVETPATATSYGMHWYSCSICGQKWEQTSYLATSNVSYNGQYNGATAAGNKTGTTTTPSKNTGKTTSSSTNKKGVSIPKTNDTTSNLPYVLIAVAFVGLVALVASKKKVNG